MEITTSFSVVQVPVLQDGVVKAYANCGLVYEGDPERRGAYTAVIPDPAVLFDVYKDERVSGSNGFGVSPGSIKRVFIATVESLVRPPVPFKGAASLLRPSAALAENLEIVVSAAAIDGAKARGSLLHWADQLSSLGKFEPHPSFSVLRLNDGRLTLNPARTEHQSQSRVDLCTGALNVILFEDRGPANVAFDPATYVYSQTPLRVAPYSR